MRLRLEGSCSGCPSSTVTLKHAIEDAIHEAAPDVEGIEAEDAPAAPGADPARGCARARCRRADRDRGCAALAQRSRGRARGRRSSAATCAARRSRPSTATCSTCRARELLCACRACALLFDRARRARPLPARARPAAAARRLRARRRRVGGAAAAGRHGVLLPRSAPAGRVRGVLPEPDGRRPSRCSSSTRGSSSRRANPVLATLEPDVEALLVNRARGAREHWLVPIDDCYALVGLIRTRWRGLTGGARGVGGDRAFFDELDRRASRATNARSRMAAKIGRASPTRARRTRTGVKQGNADGQLREAAGPPARRARDRRALDRHQRRQARADRPADAEPAARVESRCRARRAVPELAFAVADAARVEHAAVPTLRFALRVESARRASRSARCCSTRRSRSRRAGARYDDAAHERLFELFGPAEQWGSDPAHAAVDARDARRPAVHGQRPSSSCPIALHLRPRGRGVALLRRARRRRGAARVPVQRHRLLRAADGRLQAARISWEQRGRVPAAGRGVARDDGPPLPRHARGCGCGKRAVRPRWPPTRRATRWPTWEDVVDALLDRSADAVTRSARSPTPCSTRATCCGRTAARR